MCEVFGGCEWVGPGSELDDFWRFGGVWCVRGCGKVWESVGKCGKVDFGDLKL